MIQLPKGYRLSDKRDEMQADAIHAYLTTSYWAQGIPLDIVEQSIKGSLCVGLFHGEDQVGFARLVTDMATFAYLGRCLCSARSSKTGTSQDDAHISAKPCRPSTNTPLAVDDSRCARSLCFHGLGTDCRSPQSNAAPVSGYL